EQWFIAMENNDLRGKALAAIRQVSWVPKWGMERIYGMVESRPDWCLSRQRAWGVPITVFSCKQCGEIVRDEQVAARIVDFFRTEGADAWFRREPADFLGENGRCAKCGGAEFEKEQDILDVWFDSGVSYAAVLEERPELACPADLYLEGSDQHRGWFQSSLLAAVGTRGVPPYKGVLTHGFVVDGQGKKMSKSIGNVIAPSEIIEKYGAEILRLWVASEDYRDDVKISDDILRQLSDAYRKIRNTIRFLLGNLADFDPAAHRVAYADMEELDQWALHELEQVKRKVTKAYEGFEFHAVFHGLYQFCTVTMSALYLDILKDRLYTSLADARDRRAAQTVLYDTADAVVRLMGPILAFTAAEAWGHLPAAPGREENAHVARFPAPEDDHLRPELGKKWERLLAVRAEVTKALELARQDKVIGHSLEADVEVAVGGELAEFVTANWELLKMVAMVSDLRLVADTGPEGYRSAELPDLSVLVRPAAGGKCERCWTRSETVGANEKHPLLCSRCTEAVTKLGF
ncbi:MAG: class I tRNA ligase family protein, partial [Desulfobacteraceae bacterium]|nr:class I tRNA ligase family protein [Desulfobacteraceae bacterium]